jgi:hypothetical protein
MAVSLFACVLFFGQSLGVLVIATRAEAGTLATAFSIVAVAMLLLGGWVSHHVQARQTAWSAR